MYDRDFKGVWIPKEIWLSENLSALEKVLLVEIDSLDKNQGCFAGNKHFGTFLSMSESSVTKHIRKLKDLGYIKQASFDGRKRVLKSCLQYDSPKITRQSSKKLLGRVTKNGECNNTGNNTDTIKKNIKKKPITENASGRKRAQSKKKKSPPKKKKAPPTREECVSYFRDKWAKKHNKSPEACAVVAAMAWEYYDRSNWRDRNNSKVRNWKLKLMHVWMTDDKLDEFKPKKKIKISTGKVVYHK